MTVKEIRERLEGMDEDLQVLMAYPSGDYWRTVIAGKIDTVETCRVEWSQYHGKFVLPKEGKDEPEDGEEVVVLI